MTVQELLQEFGFELDDVRWYLSVVMTERILRRKEKPLELTEFVWSGALERELYDMEERYLRELQNDLDRNLTDETRIRETFHQIAREKRHRKDARIDPRS